MFREILAVTVKDLKILLRARDGLAMVLFVMPVMLIIVMLNRPGWALIGMFVISGVLTQSLLREKHMGTFCRLMASPMSRVAVVLGKLIPHVIVNVIQIALLLLTGDFILPLIGQPRLDWGAHPEVLIVISLCLSIIANALGLLLTATGKRDWA